MMGVRGCGFDSIRNMDATMKDSFIEPKKTTSDEYTTTSMKLNLYKSIILQV